MKKITLTQILHILPVVISVIALCIAITKPTKVVTTNEKVVVQEDSRSAVQKNCRHSWSTVTEDRDNHSIVLSCDKCGLIQVINTLKYGEY